MNCCVAAGCSNTPSDHITLFKFPSDPKLREKWAKQVRRTRANWKPTKHSVVCSEHFTQDCFEADAAIAATLGISKKRRLKPDAVPTIFRRESSSMTEVRSESQAASSSTTVSRKRLADVEPAAASSSVKRSRGAAEKRERIRVSRPI